MKGVVIMKNTYKEIVDIIEIEMHEELLSAKTCKWMMKRTFNPIRKLRYYLDAKRFMNHVIGMELIMYKIRKTMKEEP